MKLYVGKHKQLGGCKCDKRLAKWGLSVTGKAKPAAAPVAAPAGSTSQQPSPAPSVPPAASVAAPVATAARGQQDAGATAAPQTAADVQSALFAHVVDQLGGRDRVQAIVSEYLRSHRIGK